MEYKEFISKNGYMDNSYGQRKYAEWIADQKRVEQRRKARAEGAIAPEENNPNQYDGQYIPIPFEKLDDEIFRKRYASKILLYMWMRRFITRAPAPSDKYDIYGRFYKSDNKFATTMSTRRLAKDLGCSRRTIIKWLQDLSKDGFIVVETIPIEKGMRQNVILFGGFEAGKPKYYIDEVAMFDEDPE